VKASDTTPTNDDIAKPVRCAVYARVSVDDTNSSEFTSIDAQVEACRDFIASQRALGWVAIEPSYADHGYSGSNLDRPALKALLADMAKQKVDVVVVHRLDRLSRSIGDLCALVPLFEGPSIRLVSLAQSIDTATPSGRLTLNLLTSFSQFEREVTGERTREKLAVTRARGMWQGNATPLGYGVDWNQRVVVVEPEAGAVRDIFRRFVALGSTSALLEYLARLGFRTKAWKTKDGKKRGGRTFDRNALYKLLNNRMYIGEVFFNGAWHRGQHTPIVDLELWHQVHDLMMQRARRTGVSSTPRSEVAFPLKGRLFWEDGRPFKPLESSQRKGRRYRYYIPHRSAEEKAHGTGPVNLPADEIHAAVVHYLRSGFRAPQQWLANLPEAFRTDPVFEESIVAQALGRLDGVWDKLFEQAKAPIIRSLVGRVTIYPEKMAVRIDIQSLAEVVRIFTPDANGRSTT
jgi:site-specific DNA recombinase